MFMKYPFTEMCNRKIKIHSKKLFIFKKSFSVSVGKMDYANKRKHTWKKGVHVVLRIRTTQIRFDKKSILFHKITADFKRM